MKQSKRAKHQERQEQYHKRHAPLALTTPRYAALVGTDSPSMPYPLACTCSQQIQVAKGRIVSSEVFCAKPNGEEGRNSESSHTAPLYKVHAHKLQNHSAMKITKYPVRQIVISHNR